jgi:hypothetical protein
VIVVADAILSYFNISLDTDSFDAGPLLISNCARGLQLNIFFVLCWYIVELGLLCKIQSRGRTVNGTNVFGVLCSLLAALSIASRLFFQTIFVKDKQCVHQHRVISSENSVLL